MVRGARGMLAGIALLGGWAAHGQAAPGTLQVEGLAVTPHVQSRELRWRREAGFNLGARVEIFLRNAGAGACQLVPDTPVQLRGKPPAELLARGEWAWHDFPSA